MKVLVFGSTGFIGHPVALALVNAGHDVYGVTRSSSSASSLQAEEITPIIADPLDASTYKDVIAKVDVVIDCTGGNAIKDVGMKILDTTIEVAAEVRKNGPPLQYVYCAGTWLHGDNKTEIVSDRSPITSPMPITSWRLDIERKATTSISRSFTANVVRPGMLYGTSGSLFGQLFQSARDGKIVWAGDEDTRVGAVHQTDVAECFRLVVEKGYMVPGVIFDATTAYPDSLRDIIHQLKLASGAKEVEFTKADNPFLQAVNASCVGRPTLAKSLLGWEARKAPLSQGLAVYYAAWLATQPSSTK